MNFVGQGILDLSRIRPTHCVFSALVKASVTHLSIELLYPRDNVLIVPCENVRFRKSDIRFFIAYFSKENLDVRGHYSDEF